MQFGTEEAYGYMCGARAERVEHERSIRPREIFAYESQIRLQVG
jgi:hypothetical protein